MIERTKWIRALSELPSDELLDSVLEISKFWKIQPKALSHAGLGMLQLEDGALKEPFFLGEFPLASAWVEIKTPDGKTAQGAAQIMDDNVELVETLAICDAILSARLPNWERLADMLERGAEALEQKNRERKQMLASTQVNFSLLDDVGGEHATRV
jgi:alpha-D-ribose 1-methylphosphonate 5-triphosphate synthase subunit PhnG